MGSMLGGGGGSTQTVTQNSTPFNAQALNTVEQAALNLGQTNPLQAYPGQTYAAPNDIQNNALAQTGYWGNQAGNSLSAQVPQLQQSAINDYQNVANGSNQTAMGPILNAINGMANINAAQPGINFLNPIANGSYFNGEQPYFSGLQGAATSGVGSGQLQNMANGGYLNAASPYLSGLSNVANGPGGNILGNVAGGQYLNASSPYLSGLSNAANGPGGSALGSIAGGQYLQGESPYLSGLTGVASGGPAANSLAASASGQFLNSNPYLNGMFNAAAQPVISAFQTATAPTIDSRMEAAGRFNSGANANAQSQAQQDLGRTLDNLASNIYGQNYSNERGLMNQAATNLGGLQTNALNAAGGLYNTGVNTLGNAASSLGNLNLSGLTNALSGYNQGVNTLTGAAGTLGGLNETGLANALQGYGTQTGQIGSAANNLLTGNISGLNNAASQYNNAVSNIGQTGYQSGLLGLSGQDQMMRGFQNQINDTLNLSNQQLNAANGLVGLSQMPFQDYSAALGAGNNVQSNQQAQINALMNQFNSVQNAPWNTLNNEAALVGNAITGQTATTSPMNTTSPLGNIVGGLSAANALGGSNGLLSSGGLLGSQGGLFGTAGLLGSQGPLLGTAADASIAAGGPPLALDAAAKAPMAFSDRRLKTDIEKLGELGNGLPVYSFKYIWDDEPHIGLMADEVEKVHPEAVLDLGGFKVVNYARAVAPR